MISRTPQSIENNGFHKTSAWKNAQSAWNSKKRLDAVAKASSEIVTCPYCGVSGGKSATKGWHFDHCKQNPNRIPRNNSKSKKIKVEKSKKPKFDYESFYNALPTEFKMSEARNLITAMGRGPQSANVYIQTSDKFEKICRGMYRKIK